MSFGMEVWDETGVKILSTQDRFLRIIYNGNQPSTGSLVLPLYTDARGFVTIMPDNPSAIGIYIFTDVSKTLTWDCSLGSNCTIIVSMFA